MNSSSSSSALDRISMAMDPKVLAATIVLSMLGVCTNALGATYTVKHFGAKRTVFLLLFTDSIVSMVGCLISVASCIILLLNNNKDDDYSFVGCYALYLVLLLSPTLGYFLMMEISMLRLHSVKLSMCNAKADEKKTLRRSLFFLSLPVAYLASVVTYCAINRIPYSLWLNTCVSGESAEVPYWLTTASVSLPSFLLIPTATLVSDLATVVALRGRGNNFDGVPVRATLFSAMFLVTPVVAAVVVKVSNVSKVATAGVWLVYGSLFFAARCPAATFVSFAYKSGRERRMRCQSREVRLKKVLSMAKKERQMMRGGETIL